MQKICNSETNIIQPPYIIKILLTFCYVLSVYRFILNIKKLLRSFMLVAADLCGQILGGLFMSEYESFVAENCGGAFTQSEMWAEVKNNWKCERLTVKDSNGQIKASVQILIKEVPFLRSAFMYAPRGIIGDYSDKHLMERVMEQVGEIRRRHNAFMLKIDPMITEDNVAAIKMIEELGFVRSSKDEDSLIQCMNNYVLDINGRTEEEILASFHKKWRYNINLAQRKGVVCGYYGVEKLDDFYFLLKETAKRDGFNIRSEEYLEKILNSFGEHCRLYMCYLNGTPLSGAIAINYGGRVSYLYGASSDKMRNVMPCYLMQWNMIKWAVESGCTKYDFMGIPHFYDENHPNYGVYRFKKGFNGEVVTYAGEFDYIYRPAVKAIVSAGFKLLHMPEL